MSVDDPDTPSPGSRTVSPPICGVLVASWNLNCLRADRISCVPTDAWRNMNLAIISMNATSTQIEVELEESDVHSSQLWFAWGLLHLHAAEVQKFYWKNMNGFDCLEMDSKLSEIENDVRHILHCLDTEPLDRRANARIVNLCFDALYSSIINAFRASRTIFINDIPRFKRRKGQLLLVK